MSSRIAHQHRRHNIPSLVDAIRGAPQEYLARLANEFQRENIWLCPVKAAVLAALYYAHACGHSEVHHCGEVYELQIEEVRTVLLPEGSLERHHG